MKQAVAEPQTPRKGLVFWLSWADLAHEWVLSLCLVLAVAAILGPLLLLFGLKYGTIATLRQRLIEDPRNREIRPLVSRSFSRVWFEQLRHRRDVAFVIPMTRQIAATVQVKLADQEVGIPVDLVPTAAGDRLLLENGAAIPAAGECVLSAMAAEALGVEVGQRVIMEARRLQGTRYESGSVPLRVSGILDARAGALKLMYVQLEILEAVEQYKDGQAVPRYGWPGSTPVPHPRYHGVLVALPEALDRVEQVMLTTNTGFTGIETVTAEQLTARAGYRMAPERALYLLSTRHRAAGEESVRAVALRLRGKQAVLLPWIDGLAGELLDAAGKPLAELRLQALSLASGDTAGLGLMPLPDWPEAAPQGTIRRRIMLPPELAGDGRQFTLRVATADRSLEFPVQAIAAEVPQGRAFLPAELAGILALLQERSISFEPDSGQFVLGRRGYAGFRLYATEIDAVDDLRRGFEAMGIPVHTEAERIRDVTELDTYLTLIFWLVALVGLVGGAASLVASLYASVQRKRRDLGVLRLLGLNRETIFRFPVYQGLLIAGSGFAVAGGFFQTLAWLINALFQAHLRTGESLCRLPLTHLLSAMAGTLTIAVCASIAAAWRTTSIDPSEALRDE